MRGTISSRLYSNSRALSAITLGLRPRDCDAYPLLHPTLLHLQAEALEGLLTRGMTISIVLENQTVMSDDEQAATIPSLAHHLHNRMAQALNPMRHRPSLQSISNPNPGIIHIEAYPHNNLTVAIRDNFPSCSLRRLNDLSSAILLRQTPLDTITAIGPPARIESPVVKLEPIWTTYILASKSSAEFLHLFH